MYSTYSQLDECLAKCHMREQTRIIHEAAEAHKLANQAKNAQSGRAGFAFGALFQWLWRYAEPLGRRWKLYHKLCQKQPPNIAGSTRVYEDRTKVNE